MFTTAVIKLLHQQCPFLAFLHHMFEQEQKLLKAPSAFCLGWIKVVQPSFPALLGRPQIGFIGRNEKTLGYFVPLGISFSTDQIVQHIVFFIGPFGEFDFFVKEGASLVFEKVVLLDVENAGEIRPVIVILGKKIEYECGYWFSINFHIANNGPEEEA